MIKNKEVSQKKSNLDNEGLYGMKDIGRRSIDGYIIREVCIYITLIGAYMI